MPFFYDSYAILEYLNGNVRYAGYFEEDYGFLTTLNLMEIYYALLRRYGDEAAEEGYEAFSRFNYQFGDGDVKDAMKLRLRLQQRGWNLSYADALGYHLANRLRVRFLTGDRAFESLENVEYIK